MFNCCSKNRMSSEGRLSSDAWYLVYSKLRQEALACANLERQGYRTYLPVIRKASLGARGATVRVAPMFPRYLFILLNRFTQDWGPIRSTVGVVSLVRFGPEPSVVPNQVLLAIRGMEGADGIIDIPRHLYGKGERVRIVEGRFAGYEGMFLAQTARERVTVLLNILGRQTPAHLDEQSIEPAS
jgi:transcriptional antiterminator RfaH